MWLIFIFYYIFISNNNMMEKDKCDFCFIITFIFRTSFIEITAIRTAPTSDTSLFFFQSIFELSVNLRLCCNPNVHLNIFSLTNILVHFNRWNRKFCILECFPTQLIWNTINIILVHDINMFEMKSKLWMLCEILMWVHAIWVLHIT